MVHFRAKFEVSIFNRSRDIRGSQNFKIGSRDPHMIPFDPILIIFWLELTAFRLRAKFEVSAGPSAYMAGEGHAGSAVTIHLLAVQ